MPIRPPSLDRYQRTVGAVVLTGIAAGLLLFAGRLFQINTELSTDLREMAEDQRRGHSIVPARRGMILDARGRVVATSRQRPDVFVDPARISNLPRLAGELGPRINRPAMQLIHRIEQRKRSRFVVVAGQVDEITADAVRQLKHPAVGLTQREIRTYPLGESMAHVLGMVGRDGVGQEGIELQYDDHLRGRDGRRETIRDARRRAIEQVRASSAPPVDGGHIVLTIDSEVQRITEEALAFQVAAFEAQSGVAVVLSPRNGDVLAMACVPMFDANRAGNIPPGVRRNRAITDPTEPGSAFKPVIVSGALDGQFVSSTELIDCGRGKKHFGRRILTDTMPGGMLDLKGIITKSSNIGMGIIAERMGNEVLRETIRRFGFGERSGLDFPGEDAGLVHALRNWTRMSAASVGMGYEIGVTPLQLANAFATIANGGILLRPRLVKRLLGPDGSIVRSFDEPEIIRRAVSSATARYVAQELLVSVVEHGGGCKARIGPYRVLGKTGTAKLPYPDRPGYEPGAYLGTFVGAAPAHDPQIVVLVMIRRPNAALGYYGSTVAAPAVGEIIASTLAYLGVEPEQYTASSGL